MTLRTFFVGGPCPVASNGVTCPTKVPTSQPVMEEGADVVPLQVTDVYRHLPRKLKLSYDWALANTDARWMVKVDEDFFVDAASLVVGLASVRDRDTVLGCIRRKDAVHRTGKWAENTFLPSTYPPFPLGSCGHAVSRDVAEYVVSKNAHEYQGEDTSMGIWLEERKETRFLDSPYFSNDGLCSNQRGAERGVVGHDLTPSRIRACGDLPSLQNSQLHNFLEIR